MTDTKRCPGLGGTTEAHEADLAAFSRNQRHADGLSRTCKSCETTYRAAYRAASRAADRPAPTQEEPVTEPTNGVHRDDYPTMNDLIRGRLHQRQPSRPAGPPPPGDDISDPLDRAIYAEATAQGFVDPIDAVRLADRSLLRVNPDTGLPINAPGVVTALRRSKPYMVASPDEGMPQARIHQSIVDRWRAEAEAATATDDGGQAPTDDHGHAGFNQTIRQALGRGTTTTEGDDQS